MLNYLLLENISFFADKCKCLVFANLDATEPDRTVYYFYKTN